MKALLLNSGVGKRMGALTSEHPKCMTPIGGGYTILSRQLAQLAQAGIQEVVITTGPFAETLQAYVAGLHLPLKVQYAHNPDYATTNYIVSILKAAPWLTGDDILLFHGDLVMEQQVLRELVDSRRSVMAVDSTLPLPQKDFKARLREGRIVAVGVAFFGEDCVACQPAYRWQAEDFAAWLAAMARMVAGGETGVYAENAFNEQDGAIPLSPLELRGRLCAEIDNAEDLATVGEHFRSLLAAETPSPVAES